MTILDKRNYKRFGAAAFGLAGLLAASVATAGHGGYGGGDDDKKDEDDKDDKHGKKEPRFEDRGDSLRATARVRGLKHNKNVKVELTATARVKLECDWKGGHGNDNKKKKDKDYTKNFEIELEGEEFFSKKDIEDGKLRIEVETEDARDALEDDHDGGKWGDDDDYGCGRSTTRKSSRFASSTPSWKSSRATRMW
jgi:hypothetical protein